MTSFTRRLAPAALLVLAVALGPASARGQVLLRDDFEGTSLDAALWFMPFGEGTFFGRTQLRPPEYPLVPSGGTLLLPLDTHNPNPLVPGDSFFGSEIVSQLAFARASGLAVRARVRLVAPLPRGLVASLFTFVYQPATLDRDELDFELLSNDANQGLERVLTNAFDDAPFTVPGDAQFVTQGGFDPFAWNELELRWLPDRVQWFVNGELGREELETVPDADMPVRLNFWAPADDFAAAYDAGLVPVASAELNQVFYYELDFVEVRRLPDPPVSGLRPGPALLLAAGLAGAALLALARRPARRRKG